MNKRYVVWLCALFVLFDLGYSYIQNYQLPLEGDLAPIVLPSFWYSQVLQDPFGWAVLAKNEVYAGPNRYFAHAAMVGYFKSVPLWLQRFTNPISSVYMACALFKTAVQALLLYLLAVYCTGAQRLTDRRLWLPAALLVPLFQTAGYNGQMGVIDHSITYTFFYAFPLALLLVLLLPFYRAAYGRQPLRLSWVALPLIAALMVVLAFNGPIVTGAVLVLGVSIGLYWIKRQWPTAQVRSYPGWWLRQAKQVPLVAVLLLGLFVMLCLYSLYIGRNNSENLTATLPLWERYKLVPQGIFRQLTGKLGFPLLVLIGLVNAQLIRRFLPPSAASSRLLRILQLLGLFTLIYILLLPLGGYRSYRPLILRRDSILPIILGLMYFYGASTYYLLQHLPGRPRRWYMGGLVLFGAIFMNADKLRMTDNNQCERAALQQLAQASEPIVHLTSDCTVMAWEKITDPLQSDNNAQLLELWGVTKGKKLYYQ
ncbi:hypothetical protein SAMN00120144_0534 [Hymenobacter roseosalivarius DSM 11622]|uniref:Glycosyltransferase RgtA/B/C/D-like domain-containing protein n=1 Tax=Hymenobacter roseosalivarius DSM 11622 TaxID=645990 RepID=A0A1W1VT86_9BACT|nr:hypothetical protein [Hymenobacter roseosalivarius]SMB96094.1 hypothetical protein SAMN00120144_0534 [Hymenobacter roseosalivarius DSM 11622]